MSRSCALGCVAYGSGAVGSAGGVPARAREAESHQPGATAGAVPQWADGGGGDSRYPALRPRRPGSAYRAMAAPGSAAPIVPSIPTLHWAAPCCAPLVALARNALRSAEARPTAVPEAGYCPSRTAACACVVSVALAVPGSPDRRSARAAALAGLHLVRGVPGAAHIDAVADLLLRLVCVLPVDQLASHHPALQRPRTERVVDDFHGRVLGSIVMALLPDWVGPRWVLSLQAALSVVALGLIGTRLGRARWWPAWRSG